MLFIHEVGSLITVNLEKVEPTLASVRSRGQLEEMRELHGITSDHYLLLHHWILDTQMRFLEGV